MSDPSRSAPDHTVVTTQRRRLLSGYKRGERFDDHIDTGPEISNVDAVKIVWRAVKLLGHAKGLFATKFLMSTAIWIPGLFLGWFGKIIMDHVILARELDADDPRYVEWARDRYAIAPPLAPWRLLPDAKSISSDLERLEPVYDFDSQPPVRGAVPEGQIH